MGRHARSGLEKVGQESNGERRESTDAKNEHNRFAAIQSNAIFFFTEFLRELFFFLWTINQRNYC